MQVSVSFLIWRSKEDMIHKGRDKQTQDQSSNSAQKYILQIKLQIRKDAVHKDQGSRKDIRKHDIVEEDEEEEQDGANEEEGEEVDEELEDEDEAPEGEVVEAEEDVGEELEVEEGEAQEDYSEEDDDEGDAGGCEYTLSTGGVGGRLYSFCLHWRHG